MALATAMVNSPDVFQCFTRASLTVVWASAGAANVRIITRCVFMICLGTTIHIAEWAVRANGWPAEFCPDSGGTRPGDGWRARHWTEADSLDVMLRRAWRGDWRRTPAQRAICHTDRT